LVGSGLENHLDTAILLIEILPDQLYIPAKGGSSLLFQFSPKQLMDKFYRIRGRHFALGRDTLSSGLIIYEKNRWTDDVNLTDGPNNSATDAIIAVRTIGISAPTSTV